MNPDKGLRGRINSFAYAFEGVAELVRSQPNARIHLVATLVVVVLGFSYGLSVTEWCLVVLAVGMVWCAEALNTSLEILCDKVEPERHPAIKQVKDIAAAGVLFAAIAAAIVGLLIFLPKLFA